MFRLTNLFIIILFSSTANSAIINFNFKGTIGYSAALANVGDQIDGQFSYDTSYSTGSMLEAYGYASYNFPSNFSISANVNGHKISSHSLGVTVIDNFGGNIEDSVEIYGTQPNVDGEVLTDGYFGLLMASGAGVTNVINDTGLPSTYDILLMNVSKYFNSGRLQVDGSSDGTLLVFSIDSISNDSISPSPVPLPPALLFMASGIIALFGNLKTRYKKISVSY